MDICCRSKDIIKDGTNLRNREITLAGRFIFVGDALGAENLLQVVLRYFKCEASSWHMEDM